jgi:perosamine synthetase
MIPVNTPVLEEEDIKAAEQALREGWFSSAGRYVEEFEANWSAYCGAKHGIAVSNGTTALQVAVEALRLGKGDEVIMPSYTIISCASAVIRAGATPVLVDCDPIHFNMVTSEVEAKITPRTKAIMLVHMFGHPVDMDALSSVARRHGLKIIEDAAEAHGAQYLSNRNSTDASWKICGGMGDVSTFSFFANKLITTGEGGMVVTNDPDIAARARSLRNLCFRTDRRFLHTEHGHQFRLTSLQSALALGQIRRMDKIIAKKRHTSIRYRDRLSSLNQLQLATEENWAKSVFWVNGLVLDESSGMDAVAFAQRLKAKGVETRPFFLGMHEQPVFHNMGLFGGEHYKVTERIAKQGLYLPSGLALTDDEIDKVSDAVHAVLA